MDIYIYTGLAKSNQRVPKAEGAEGVLEVVKQLGSGQSMVSRTGSRNVDHSVEIVARWEFSRVLGN